MKKIIVLFTFLTFALFAKSQEKSFDFEELGIFESGSQGSKVTITQDEKLLSTIKSHIESYSNLKSFYGWRLQIYLGTGRQAKEKANSVKTNFTRDYPDVEVYVTYDPPYFKVRVGDFRSRQEAFRFKKHIESKFSTTWVVEDKINFPKLDTK